MTPEDKRIMYLVEVKAMRANFKLLDFKQPHHKDQIMVIKKRYDFIQKELKILEELMKAPCKILLFEKRT